MFDVLGSMSPTVNELRNQIRTSVGRFEREIDAQFTKEELAAIADAVGESDGNHRPSKETMRKNIRQRSGLDEDVGSSAFTKDELETIADTLKEK